MSCRGYVYFIYIFLKGVLDQERRQLQPKRMNVKNTPTTHFGPPARARSGEPEDCEELDCVDVKEELDKVLNEREEIRQHAVRDAEDGREEGRKNVTTEGLCE